METQYETDVITSLKILKLSANITGSSSLSLRCKLLHKKSSLMSTNNNSENPDGKLLVLTPGMGAVATTFIAGVESIRKGLSKPIGSLTQMQTIRLGARSDNRNPLIKDFLPLASLEDLTFGGWDVKPDNVYDACVHAQVLKPQDVDPIADFLKEIKPMSAAF